MITLEKPNDALVAVNIDHIVIVLPRVDDVGSIVEICDKFELTTKYPVNKVLGMIREARYNRTAHLVQK